MSSRDADRVATEEAGSSGGTRRERGRQYWRANLRVMTALMIIWAAVSYGLGIVLVEPLNAYRVGGFPLGFWIGHQGAMYVFVVLVWVYALWMDRLDRRYLVE